MPIAGTQNIMIDQGADWWRDLVLADASGTTCDLSGYTAVAAYCAAAYNDPAAITMQATFVDSDNQESIDGDSSGVIRIGLTEEQSAAISWTRGYYDIYLTEPSGDRIRILQGQMTVRPKVPASAA